MGLIPEGTIRILRRLKKMGYSDKAIRLIYSSQASGYSYGRPSFSEGESFDCRVVFAPSNDLMPGADVPMGDAELFFDREFVLLPDDHVRVTHIHGDEVTAQDYQIIAGPYQDSLGKSARLKLYKGD